MKNPLPHLREVTDAAANVAFLKRDLYVLDAEMKVVRQARRLALVVAGAISLNVMATLTLFWVTQMLHESGWSAGWIATLSLLFLGSLSALLLGKAFR